MRFEQPQGAIHLLPHHYAAYLGRNEHRLEEVVTWLLREHPPAYGVLLPLIARGVPERLELFLSEALNS